MNCPVCGKEFVEKDFGNNIKVDICENGCKSIWFDWLELVRLDENHEGAGECLEEALKAPRTNDEHRGRLNCPKCNIPMHVHPYKRAIEVNVDECYSCSGILLDSGELKTIRDEYMSNEDVEAYSSKLINSHDVYKNHKEDLAKRKERTDALNGFTKFMQVSYWGSQAKNVIKK